MTTRDVLRLRNFRLLFAGHGVSVFGDRMVTVALAFALLEVGGSASAVARIRPLFPALSRCWPFPKSVGDHWLGRTRRAYE